jgi:hypothetical protein
MMLWESSYCCLFRVGVYILALVTQHASRIFSAQQYIVICAFQDLPYFSTLYHKSREIRKRNIEHKTCVLIFSTTFVQNGSHSKENLAKCAKGFM